MGRKDYKALVVLWITVAGLAACVKDKPATPAVTGVNDSTAKIYVVCEGSLGYGNASLGMYDLQSGQAYEDVYKTANKQDLGDVFQSMTEIDGRLFLCVNNSDKIVVLDKHTHALLNTIHIPKPRYILPVSSTKAYVSTLFSQAVYIINPQTMEYTGKSITMPAQNPEGMLLHNGNAYICCWDTASDKVFRVNTTTDEIESTITVAGRAPQEVLEDKDKNLWVLSGNIPKQKDAALTCIDGTNDLPIKSYHFPAGADAIKPTFNTSRDILYFIEVNYDGGTAHNGIYKTGIYDDALPTAPLIPAKEYQYFWALGIEPVSGNLYIGDPKGFIQKGNVLIYDANGNFVQQWATGIGPGHFYFEKK